MDADSKAKQKDTNYVLADEWSNRKCIEIAYENFFPAAVANISVQKNIINRFLNFYLGAKIQKGITVNDLVYAVIAILPLCGDTDDFMFDKSHYEEDGTLFFLTPEEKLQAEVKIITEKAKEGEKDSKNVVESVEIEKSENDEQKEESNDDQGKGNDNQNEIYIESHQENLRGDANTAMEDTKANEAARPELQENEAFSAKDESQKASPKFPEEIVWFNDKKNKIHKPETSHPQYGPIENAAFVTSCNQLLDQWDTSLKARATLKYLFGIVALTLMRATTKSYKHLVNTFSSTKFLNNLPYFFQTRYCIPHKRCVKKSSRTFSKRDGNVRIMFAKIIVNSFRHAIQNKIDVDDVLNSSIRRNIFRVTVLAHTAEYGLGLVTLLQTVKCALGSLDIVSEVTHCEQTAASWKRLKDFIDKYMVRTSKERTHYWARVVDGRYFKHLCCSENYVLAVILAVFIEKATNDSGIWEWTWVNREDNNNLQTHKALGLKMYEQYKGNREQQLKLLEANFKKKYKSLFTKTDVLDLSDSSPIDTDVLDMSDSSPIDTDVLDMCDSSPLETDVLDMSDSSPLDTDVLDMSDSSPLETCIGHV